MSTNASNAIIFVYKKIENSRIVAALNQYGDRTFWKTNSDESTMWLKLNGFNVN
jgi:hypothetical protein